MKHGLKMSNVIISVTSLTLQVSFIVSCIGLS